MLKRIFSLFLSLLLIAILPSSVFAEVLTTTEQTGGTAFYIAGNPNLYPIEYYDKESKEYKGVLTEIYKQLSDATGMDFVYIRGSEVNRQEALARNKQVEIVSAHITDTVGFLSDSVHLVSFQRDGEAVSVSLGFTDIMPKEKAEQIVAYIQDLPDSKVLNLSLGVAARSDKTASLLWVYGIILLFTVAIAALIIRVVMLRRRLKNIKNNELVDPLTGIGNEKFFRNNYRHFINSSTYSLYYIVYISIKLQKIETFFGNNAAEELELFAANTLVNGVGDSDFVSRLGNGVFLLAINVTTEEAIINKVTNLVNKLNSYDRIDLKQNKAFFRAGILHLTSANIPFETAYTNSKQGYLLATDKKTLVEIANSSYISMQEEKSRLQRTLAKAIAAREFKMYLQFVIEPNTKEIVGAEALSRWHNKSDGVLKPARYIEDMHKLGLVEELDFYILEEVCKTFGEWTTDNGNGLWWISCNFARTSVSSPDFCQRFESIVGKYSFPRERLIIEITEDSLVEKSDIIHQNISACKNMGYHFALDDFGSGYSSFKDLYEYPIDMIKIDRNIMVKSVTPRGNALLKGISSLAHSLNIAVLCEGVETEEEFNVAKGVGCEFVQGFYSSRVLPYAEAKVYLQKYSQAVATQMTDNKEK